MGGCKDKVMSLFKTNTTKNYSEPTLVNKVHVGSKKPRMQKNKMIKVIKNTAFRDIKKHFAHEEYYYNPVRVSNFHKNDHIEYENNGDSNKTLSVEGYLNKIRSDLKVTKMFNNLIHGKSS